MDYSTIALRPSHSGSMMLSHLNDTDEYAARQRFGATADDLAYDLSPISHDSYRDRSYDASSYPSLPSASVDLAYGDRSSTRFGAGSSYIKAEELPGVLDTLDYPPSEHSANASSDAFGAYASSLSPAALSGVSPPSLGAPTSLPQTLSPLAISPQQLLESPVNSPLSAHSYIAEEQPPQQYVSPSELSSDHASARSPSFVDDDSEPCPNVPSKKSNWYSTVLEDTPTGHHVGGQPMSYFPPLSKRSSYSTSSSATPPDAPSFPRERSASWSRGGVTVTTRLPPILPSKSSRTPSYSSDEDESPSPQTVSSGSRDDEEYDSPDEDDSDYSPNGDSPSRKRARASRDDRPSAAHALRALEKDAPSPKRRRAGPSIPEPKKSATKSSRGRKVPSVSTRNGGLAASNLGESLGAARGGTLRGRGGGSVGSGKRQFRCVAEGCGKLFVRKEHLKRHVKSLHTEDKPHVCPYPHCEKRFSRRDNLGQHVRIHQ
ncbi:uncharacterized protein SCHCODRAFT_02594118 [Schizophyllum commune H4-8]|nr:uncharacterized protein SCHCODRAFT_02594118 [Schizophyllum commune H4-8]KAI5885003.1 hypothetical protein SCHCODRAFT_02594118 [Schizophyllum commune H4-8]